MPCRCQESQPASSALLAVLLAVQMREPVAQFKASSTLPHNGASLNMKLEVAQTWPDIMDVFGNDPRFRDDHWGRAPFLGRSAAAAGCFSVSAVRQAAEAGELLAGQNAFLVRNPESFEVAPGLARGSKITLEVLEQGLMNGTMVLNDAAAAWPELFDIARAGVRVLQMPVGINVYITHASLERSTPIHSDRQDVLVVQCEGRKHWRVHRPTVLLPAEHQERGKAGDHVDDVEAGFPLLEKTLSEGDVLYVPRGFLHSTSKPPTGPDRADAGGAFSTSLTVGLQTESMGFTYDKLLLCAQFLNGEGPTLEELRQLQTRHELLRRPLPLPGAMVLLDGDPVGGEQGHSPENPLEAAVQQLLAEWRVLFPGSMPPPLQRFRKAASIIADGHQQALQEYSFRMFDHQVPVKLRQEVWKRRYGSLVYGMLGRCGFLTRCFPQKWWLPKHTTQQRCWGPPPRQ